jgi:hypothetical protein
MYILESDSLRTFFGIGQSDSLLRISRPLLVYRKIRLCLVTPKNTLVMFCFFETLSAPIAISSSTLIASWNNCIRVRKNRM